jgi:hypothetical protein
MEVGRKQEEGRRKQEVRRKQEGGRGKIEIDSNSQLQTPNFKLPTSNSQLQTPNF